jgi:glycosyltransferase involved in cell wall biosynthesis
MDLTGLEIEMIGCQGVNQTNTIPFYEALGIKCYVIPANYVGRINSMRKIIRDGRYDIIYYHCEFFAEYAMLFAKLYGVKCRITHSHMAYNSTISTFKKLYKPFGDSLAKTFSTDLFACGIEAAKSMWGKKAYDDGKCVVLNNAIDLSRFRFNESTREAVRKEFAWEGKRVFVNVGRFNIQKNQTFLLNLFAHLCNRHEDVLLVLIGDGLDRPQIEEQIKTLGIGNRVQLLGMRGDVYRLLNGCDCFILPSFFEGLPVVAIEAQTNGLPIVMSDTVTKECGITDLASYVSLQAPYETWEQAIMKKHPEDRTSYPEKVSAANFNINEEAHKLREFFLAH